MKVTAAVLGAGVMYSVLVEGTDPVSIPHAVRFAKRLAKEGNGAAMDAQTEEIWPKTSTRAATKPERDMMVDTVEVRWYHLMDEVRDDFPQKYLNLARQYLPEAVPKRFGSYEPLQGNLARDGDKASTRRRCKQTPRSPTAFGSRVGRWRIGSARRWGAAPAVPCAAMPTAVRCRSAVRRSTRFPRS